MARGKVRHFELARPSLHDIFVRIAAPDRRRTPMRKMLVIASREYLAAVRTKSFLISLLVLPIMMGGGAVFQTLLKDVREHPREKVCHHRS